MKFVLKMKNCLKEVRLSFFHLANKSIMGEYIRIALDFLLTFSSMEKVRARLALRQE